MSNYDAGHRLEWAVRDALPKPRANSPLCGCGCGYRTSSPSTEYIRRHRPRVPIVDRLARHINVGDLDECWEWIAARATNGYGLINVGGSHQVAHRAAWKALVGDVSDDLQLDHLCGNRACCNPDHLEPVTPAENVRRSGALAASIAARQNTVTCKRGHERTPENTHVNRKTGRRTCRPCGRAASLAWWYRQKAASA